MLINPAPSYPDHRIDDSCIGDSLTFPFATGFGAQPSQQTVDPAGEHLTPGLAKTAIFDGWISLFDGKTLFGWKPETKANWHVVDGEIRVSQGEIGLLRTTSQFDDFEIATRLQIAARTNSGLFLRTSPSPKDPADDCFELNIAHPGDNPFPTGSLVFRQKSTPTSNRIVGIPIARSQTATI